ncbi:DUF2513 domain-containing protein [Pseudomonas sp.]|uniref:DUF2513 domain-containing protein n=1 Tax=Pseudomonas sp. TaxID=306 RepID=UPI003D0E3C7A
MKRDWNLIRSLLLEIEALEWGRQFSPRPLDGHSLEVVNHHLHLLEKAGLVECIDYYRWNGEPARVANALTLLGHDLLDSIRDDDGWYEKKASLLTYLGMTPYDAFRPSA